MNEQPTNSTNVNPPVVPAPATTPPAEPQTAAPAKKTTILPWILGGVGALVVIGAVLFMMLLYPGIQAKSVATGFMDALKKGDDSKIKQLSGEDTTDAFITSAKKGMSGASFTLVNSTQKDKSFIVDFDVSGSSAVKDTSVTVTDGKVAGLNLNVRNKVADSASTTSTQAAPATSTCLTVSDLQASGVTYIDSTSFKSYAGSVGYFGAVFFKPDSTDYLLDSAAEEASSLAAAVYNGNKTKDFSFVVSGSVHETTSTAAGVTLANQRAEKIKAAIVAKGVPADRVEIGDPTSNSLIGDGADADRNISIGLKIPESCKGATASNSSM